MYVCIVSLKRKNTWFHKFFVLLGTHYRITECHTLSPALQLPVPGAYFSVYLTTPGTTAGAACHLVLLRQLVTLALSTPSASGSEPPGRTGDPSLPVRSLYLSHRESAPAASPAAQVPALARSRSGQGLQKGTGEGRG